MSARLKDENVEAYLTAGKVTIILISTSIKDRHYSFNINDWKKVPGMYFVEYKGEHTQKMGYFKKGTAHSHSALNFTLKGELEEDADPVRAFKYLIDCINLQKPITLLEVWHDGSCGRCGRPLNDPESIDRGFGPECWKLINKL